VVLGEPSLVTRNRDAASLLEAGFSVLDRRGLGQIVTVASVLPPEDHSPLRTEPAIDQGASDEPDAPAPVRHAERRAEPAHRVHGRMEANAPSRHHERQRDRHVAKSHAATKKTPASKSTRRHHH
jgi:D-alanyl-D-alanine carboxypeptidase